MIEFLKSKKHLFAIFVPLLFCIAYLIFCTLNLTSSVWFDESYSAFLIRGSFKDIWELTSIDVHPPFFYFCLKIWSLVFGTSDIALRFMSVFFGGLTIILLFHLLGRWFGTKPAAIATAFLTLSPLFIRYGQEMRMYTLVFFIVVAATYSLTLALETERKRFWVLYAVLIALGMWTHYFTALAWITQLGYLIFVQKKNPFKKPLLPTYLLAVLLYVPWLPFFIRQSQSVQGGFWIPEVTAVTPVNYLTNVFFYQNADDLKGWPIVLFLSVVIFTTFIIIQAWRKLAVSKRKPLSLLLLLAICPPIFLLLLSLPPLKPVFVDRYVIYSAALLWLSGGLSLALLRERSSKTKLVNLIFAVLLLITGIFALVNVTNRKPDSDVKDIILATTELSEAGEPILVDDIWNYYDAIFYSTDEHPIYADIANLDFDYGSEEPVRQYNINLIHNFKDFANQTKKFWLVMNAPDDEDDSGQIESPIKGYYVIHEISDGKHLALELERE